MTTGLWCRGQTESPGRAVCRVDLETRLASLERHNIQHKTTYQQPASVLRFTEIETIYADSPDHLQSVDAIHEKRVKCQSDRELSGP
jgi:hypothetical protein